MVTIVLPYTIAIRGELKHTREEITHLLLLNGNLLPKKEMPVARAIWL